MAISKRKWSAKQGSSHMKRKGGMEGAGKPISGPKQTNNYAQLRPIPVVTPASVPSVRISPPTPWVNAGTGKALKKKKKK